MSQRFGRPRGLQESKNFRPRRGLDSAEDRIITLHFCYGLDQQKACQRAAAEKSEVSHLGGCNAFLVQIKRWAGSSSVSRPSPLNSVKRIIPARHSPISDTRAGFMKAVSS
jgi:hypothetical protein